MNDVDSKKLAENITFGLGQTVACTFIDFVGDPVIGKMVQDGLDPLHKGEAVHARKAELIGDTAGFFMFLGIQKYLPGISNSLKRGAKALLDPMYEKIGNKRLQSWAKRHQVDPKSDEFRAKLEEWKDFQADNVAKTTVISAASVVANVGLQRAFGNERPLAVITAGKLAGATVTMGATLALRAFLPRAMHHIDKRINNSVTLPLIRHTQKLFGTHVAGSDAEMQAFFEKAEDPLADTPTTGAPVARNASYTQMVGKEKQEASVVTR